MTTAVEILTVNGLWKLTRQEVIDLWKQLPAPPFDELDGEYMGHAFNGGDEEARKRIADSMYNEFNGSGSWIGKAYKPTTESTGEGYNHWRQNGIVRDLRFGTHLGTSLIDGRPSLMMTYGSFNTGAGQRDLTDEIRKLADGLYIGLATTKQDDGSRTEPGFFALTGPIGPWIGVDDEAAEAK